MIKKLLLSLAAIGLLGLGSAASVLGTAKTAPETGITIAPAEAQITITASEDQHEFDFKVTNHRPSPQSLQLYTADFNALEDSGGLVFVGTKPTDAQKKYGLAHWISLPQSSITVAPGQTASLKAQILNLPDLAPGGHYGAIMIKNVSGTGGSQANVALSPIASILLFVNKAGGDIHRLSLTTVSDNHYLFKLPSTVNLRLYNAGNTHLTPRGVVTITGPGGQTYRRGIINQSSSLILPEDYRTYPVNLNKIASAWRPGKYNLTVAFRYDGIDSFRIYESSFWVLLPFGTGLLQLIFSAALVLGAGYWTRRNLTSWK